MQRISPPLVLLFFGLVAMVGVIVLEATHNLTDPTVRDALLSICLASLTGAAGVAMPAHTHDVPAAPPADIP